MRLFLVSSLAAQGLAGPARLRMWLRLLAALLLAALLLPSAAPGSQHAALKRPESITVVLDDTYPPYVFRGEDGEVQGILVDEWRAWEDATGVKVQLDAQDWDKAQQAMREGRADVIDTIFYNPERAKVLDFSKPYATFEVPVFVHKTLGGITGPTSLRGFTIGVKAGDAVIAELARYGVHTVREYESYKAIIDAARHGDIRVFSIDAPPALYFLYKHGLESEFRKAFVLYSGQFHRAVKKGDVALLRLVEEGFAAIPSARRQAIERRWMGAPLVSPQNLQLAVYAFSGIGALALALGAFSLALRRRVRARTAELSKTLDALTASEERFRAIFNSVSDLIFIHEAGNGRIADANQRACDVYGYSVTELRSMQVEALSAGWPPYTQAEASERMRLAREGRPQRFEWLARTKDGRLFWTEVFVRAALLDGAEHLLVSVRDISEHKRAEEELLFSRERLQLALDAANDGLWDWRLDSGVAYFSPRYYTMLGYEPDEFAPTFENFRALVHPLDLHTVLESVQKTLLVEDSTSLEIRMRAKSGDWVWILTRSRVTKRAEDGRPLRLTGTHSDITSRKKAEEALLASERRFSELIRNSFDSITILARDGTQVFVSNAVERMLGYSPAELMGIPVIRDMIHPDDQAHAAAAFETILREGQGGARYRHRHKDGSWVNLEAWGTNQLENPDIRGVVVNVRDITERTQAEEALRGSETKFRAVFEGSPQGMMLVDDAGTVLECNRSLAEIFGADQERYLGMNLLAGMADGPARQALEGALATGRGMYEGQYTSVFTGKTLPMRAAANRVRENLLLVVIEDETRRKEAEQALRESVAFLHSLERLDDVLRRATDLERMMGEALEVVLEELGVDRAWLFSPCDPEAPAWRVPMERTRPEYPGALAQGQDLPMTDEVREVIRTMLAAQGAVSFGPGGDKPMPEETNKPFAVKSQLLLALRPKLDRPWIFGLHQCSQQRQWSQRDRRLFEAMGSRICDGLNTLLYLQGLEESESRFRTLFEQSLDAIAIQEGLPPRFIWVNPAFCKLFGYSAAEVYAKDTEGMWTLVHPDDRELVRQSLTGRLAGDTDEVRYAFRILRKDGGERWVDVSGRRLSTAGRPMNLSIYRDSTARKRTEEALTQAKEAADEANRAKSEFLANMSHEVRTPLNGIVGMLQLLDRSELGGEQRQFAQAALESGRRLTALLGDILDISRIEARMMELEHAPFDLAEVLASVEALFRLPAEQKGLEFATRLDPVLPARLVGDAQRLRQVLFNLVGNAVKFTEQGRVSLQMEAAGCHIGGEVCRVLFTVSDTGMGIAPQRIGPLFEMFTQGEASITREHRGVGLGLAIVRHLVELMGGPGLDVDSLPGAGTVFSFVLPLALPEPGAVASDAAAPEAPPLPSLAGLCVLLVEDEPINEMALRAALEREGVEVASARTGQEALEQFRSREFDCILMDIQLPDMSGLEVTRRIRETSERPGSADIPIVALTAFAMSGDRERFLAAGMDDYLAKPFALDDLARILGRVLRGMEGRAHA